MAGPGRPHFPQSEDAVSLPELGVAGMGWGWFQCGALPAVGTYRILE